MRIRTFGICTLLGITLVAAAAFAGGHVDIKPSTFPGSLRAGKAIDVAFAMYYPNGEPVKNAHPVVWARCGDQQLEFKARPAKAAGSYVAAVKVPKEGTWAFMIDSRVCGNTCTLSKNTTVLAAAK